MAHLPDGTLLGEYEINWDILGGGGFVTGVEIANDGMLVCYCDSTSPFYAMPDADGHVEWTHFLRVGDEDWCNYNGSTADIVFDHAGFITIAKSDSDVMVAMIGGFLWRTTDGATTVERTAVPQANIDLGWARTRGTTLRIDPANPNVALYGTAAGMLYTSNLFTTTATISTAQLPVPQVMGGHTTFDQYSIMYDENSPIIGGKTSGAWCAVPGEGLYYSANVHLGASSTWTKNVAAGAPPAVFLHMAVDATNGYLHLVTYGEDEEEDRTYYRWNGSSWLHTILYDGNSQVLTGVRPVVDPHTPGRVYLPSEGSNCYSSLNYGANWAGGAGALHIIQFRVATRVGWHEFTNEYYLSHGQMEFDPVVPGRTWLATGIGTWRAEDMPDYQSAINPITWYEESAGIENLVVRQVDTASNGTLMVSVEDRVGLAVPKADIGKRFPRSNAPTAVDNVAISHGQGMDYAPEDPTFLMSTCLDAVSFGNWEWGGFSINSGGGWTAFEEQPSSVVGGVAEGQVSGGDIAVLSKDVALTLQTNNGKMLATETRGAAWIDMTPFFGPSFAFGNSYQFFRWDRKVLVKDRFHANTAYFYSIGEDPGGPTHAASRGIWKIVYNPGQTPRFTCTRVKTTLITPFWEFYNAKLVQYDDGHWLFTFGEGGQGLWETRDIDSGAAWTQVTGTDDINGNFGGYPGGYFAYVHCMAWGKGAFSGDPNTLVVMGHRPPDAINYGNHEVEGFDHDYYGMWLCRNFTDPDEDREWVRLTKFPGGQMGGYHGRFSDVASCPLEYGTHYIGNNAGGVFQMKLVDRRRASTGGADVTAPTLSSPVDTANGATGAAISVTTNEGNGTLYWYISTSATPPSAANLKSGSGAVVFGTVAVSSIGVKSANPTGLTASTAYYTYFLHRDAAGNDSTISAANGFTTTAVAAPEIWAGAPGDSTLHGVYAAPHAREAQDTNWSGVYQVKADNSITSDITPLESVFGTTDAHDRFSWLEYFGKRRNEITGTDIYLIQCAIGGTAMAVGGASWPVGQSLHEATVAHINAAIAAVKAIAPSAVYKGEVSQLGSNDSGYSPFYALSVAQIEDLHERVFMDGVSGTTAADADVTHVWGSPLPEHLYFFEPYWQIDSAIRDISLVTGGMYCRPDAGYGDLHHFSEGNRRFGTKVANYVSRTTPSTFTLVNYSIRANGPYVQELEGDDDIRWYLTGPDAAAFEIEREPYITPFGGSDVNGARARHYLQWAGGVTQASGTFEVTVNAKNGSNVVHSVDHTVTVGVPPYTNPIEILGPAFTPIGWGEAGDIANGAVASWVNKVGNTYMADPAQATASKRPTKSATSYGASKPGITFDGSDDVLVAALTGISAGTPVQALAAFQPGTNASGNPRLISLRTPPSLDYEKYIPLVFESSTQKFSAYYGVFLGKTAASSGSPHVITSAVRGAAPATHEVYVDDVSGGASIAFTYPATFAPEKLTIGAMETGGEHIAGVLAGYFVWLGEPTRGRITMLNAYFAGLAA